MKEEVEIRLASPETVQCRKWASDMFAVFNEVMNQAGVKDCETRQVYMTLINLARRAEEQAERGNVVPSEHRRFHAPNWLAELYHLHQTLPRHLDKAEFKSRTASLARQWHRRWTLIHESQCRHQLPFFMKEDGNFYRQDRQLKRKANVYTDHLTDLIVKAMKRARELRGHSITRIQRAVTETLNEFRHSTDWYAKNWTPPDGEMLIPEVDFWQTTEAKIVRFTNGLLRDAEAKGEDTEVLKEFLQFTINAKLNSKKQKFMRANKVKTRKNAEQKRESGQFSADKSVRIVSPKNAPAQDEKPTCPPIIVLDIDTASPAELSSADTSERDAAQTVEALASVGCSRFKLVGLTLKPLDAQATIVGSRETALDELRALLPDVVERSRVKQESVALRALDGSIIQVDDCSASVVERLRPHSFLVIETSRGSYQAWLAFPSDISNESRLQIRDRLLAKLKDTGANGGAYNSMRLPGTLNAKAKYLCDGNLPAVRVIETQPRHFTSLEELDAAGLLAPPKAQKKAVASYASKLPQGWPDYQSYLSAAPMVDARHPDRSNADIRWAMVALSQGWPVGRVAQELEALSAKAKGRHDDYGRKTAEKAARYLAESSSQAA